MYPKVKHSISTLYHLISHTILKLEPPKWFFWDSRLPVGVPDAKDTSWFPDQPEWPPEQRGEFFGFISGISNLTCEAQAEPPAQFTWLDRNNNEVNFGTVHNEDQKSTLSVREQGITARTEHCLTYYGPGFSLSTRETAARMNKKE